MKIISTITIILLCVSLQAQLSGDYSVGGSSPDYNTIQEAITALETQGVSASVDILIRDGIYEEVFSISEISGTAVDARVSFKSESGDAEQVIIRGAVGDADGYLWRLDGSSFLTFEELTFDNTDTTGTWDGSIGSEAAVNDLEFIGCRFLAHEDQEYNVHVNLWPQVGKALFEDNYFGPARDAFCITGGSDLTVRNNHFDIRDDMIDFEGFDSLIVQGNVFNGIEFGATAILNYGFVDYCSIRDNEFMGAINYLTEMIDGAGYIEVLDNHMNLTLESDAEMDIEYCQNLVVQRNTLEAGSGYSMYFEEAGSVLITENQASTIETYGCQGDLIIDFNELSMNNDFNEGIRMYSQTMIEGDVFSINGNSFQGTYNSVGMELDDFIQDMNSDVLVTNNEFINCSEAIEISFIDRALFSFNSFSSNLSDFNQLVDAYQVEQLTFSNNIVHLGNEIISAEIVDSDSLGFWNAHHNVYYWNAAEPQIDYYTENLPDIHSLADAQAAGYEMNSVFIDPQFFNDSLDLRICNAELQGVGQSVSGIDEDYFGQSRPAAPTPGFYEFQSLTAEFTFSQDQSLVSFEMDNWSSASSILWDFGDGATSTAVDPTHYYTNTGPYTVTLTVTNPCGSDQVSTQVIVVGSVGLEEEDMTVWSIYPNPSKGLVHLRSQEAMMTVSIYDITGRMVHSELPRPSLQELSLDLSGLFKGVYFIGLQYQDGTYTTLKKLVMH